jgi:Tat protein translocase TatB subunit
MLNVGPLELFVVLAVALIVVGPERLPELARSIGRALRQLRQVQDEVRDMVSSGIDDDVRQAATDLRQATQDLTRATDVGGGARKARRAVHDEVRRTVAPRDRSVDTSTEAPPSAPAPEPPRGHDEAPEAPPDEGEDGPQP